MGRNIQPNKGRSSAASEKKHVFQGKLEAGLLDFSENFAINIIFV